MYFTKWGTDSFGALIRLRALVIATIAALILMLSITTTPALADENSASEGAVSSLQAPAPEGEEKTVDAVEAETVEIAPQAESSEQEAADAETAQTTLEPEGMAVTDPPTPPVETVDTPQDTDIPQDGETHSLLGVEADSEGDADPGEESESLEPEIMSLLVAPQAIGDRPLGAVQDMPFCKTNSLPRNDDGSSLAVTLPFILNFFGQDQSTLYVNNNGNVTFDSPLSTYTPFNLTGNTGIPMIAPFFADVDTRNLGSLQTTYGSQGNTFCVNWVDVGYYGSRADKLISAQLIIEDRSSIVPGAFRMTFNYGPMEWETGEASGGVDGLGGDSVAAGYTSGTGNTGEYIQLPGSLVNGAMIDGGSSALSAGSRNSNVPGRYIFDVGLSAVIQQGSVDGTVTDPDDAPVAGVEISVCDNADVCVTATTSAAGTYSVAGLTVGDYTVKATAPTDSGLLNASAPATVKAGETTTVDLILTKTPENELIGIVFDEDGDVFAEATVTLEQLQDGAYVALPSGSVDLLASTSDNPVKSAADGTYNWTAVDGTYRVVAEAENCAAVTSEPVTRPIEGAEDNDAVADVAYDFAVTLVCVDPPVVVPPVITPPVVAPPVVAPPVTAPVIPPATVPSAKGLADTGTHPAAPVAVALLLVGLGAAGIMTRRRMQV